MTGGGSTARSTDAGRSCTIRRDRDRMRQTLRIGIRRWCDVCSRSARPMPAAVSRSTCYSRPRVPTTRPGAARSRRFVENGCKTRRKVMSDESRSRIERPGRRRALKAAMAAGAALIAGPHVVRRAQAQAADLGAYSQAKIDWRQVAGEQISVAVIPAGYFDNLISLSSQFEALTGIGVHFEKVPPGQIRQKAMLDLSSKTGTYGTHAADPMYY